MLSSLRRIFVWSFVLGAISFSIGFLGPMILAPGANQGPLLGIFITGPLGTLIGLAIGLGREYLGRHAGPVEVLRGWKSNGMPSEWASTFLRPGAMVIGGVLVVRGAIGVVEGEGRGAAALIVVAAAIIFYGATGRRPGWFFR